MNCIQLLEKLTSISHNKNYVLKYLNFITSRGAPKSKTWRIINEEMYTKDKTNIPIGWRLEAKSQNMIHYFVPETLECKKFIDISEVPLGWVKGGANQFGIKRTANRKWYHFPDSQKSKMFYPDTQPNGWLLGRYSKNVTNSGCDCIC